MQAHLLSKQYEKAPIPDALRGCQFQSFSRHRDTGQQMVYSLCHSDSLTGVVQNLTIVYNLDPFIVTRHRRVWRSWSDVTGSKFETHRYKSFYKFAAEIFLQSFVNRH